LVVIQLLEDSTHERLADEPTSVRDIIPVAETIQGAQFTLVEQDGDSMFARLFLHQRSMNNEYLVVDDLT